MPELQLSVEGTQSSGPDDLMGGQGGNEMLAYGVY